MQFELLTPEEPIYSGEIEMISGESTSEGSFGMLPRHLPAVMELETAPLKIEVEGEKKFFSVYGGFLVKDEEDVIKVITCSARAPEDLKKAEIEDKIEEIEEELAELPDDKKKKREELEGKLSKARTDLKVIEDSLDSENTGVVVGTGIGDISAIIENHSRMLDGGIKKVSPFLIPQLMPNAISAQIAIEYGIKGPNYGAVSACASGSHAIGSAFNEITCGNLDAVLAGGAEAPLIRLAYGGFDRMQALSTNNENPEKASRPFDKKRDGFVMGEGAGILLLESERSLNERNADPIAEIVGFGASADAHHITSPPEDGEGARKAMERALERAGISTKEIDYINAHGTSTPLNDRAETKAIKDLLGDKAKKTPVSSTKSQTGHLVGAAGGVEAAFTCLALEEGFLPPTVNYEHPDPECDLDYVPNEGRESEIEYALSNSFGFGGQNASLLFKKV